jgi:P27 family predicted phage terminase small subunit
LVKDLDALGVLARTDRDAMSRYCVAWSRYRAALAYVAEHGETYESTTQSGTMYRKYPQVDVIKQTAAEIHRLSQEFGLTPAARARLSTGEPEPQDDMLDLIQRHYGSKAN